MKAKILLFIALMWMTAGTVFSQNLILNGSFDDKEDPLKGWNYDYAWEGNSNYKDNASRVSVLPKEGGRSYVVQVASDRDAGTRLESMLIPFDKATKYRATLKIKGGPYRVYFSGYQWTPGVRPHDQPTLEEMRALYRSKAEAGEASSWQTVTLDIPGVSASEQSKQHLSRVRFVTLYIWFMRTGYVDDVTITRIN